MTAKLVRCPQCGLSVEYRTDNPSRPFCSARCKLIDLGAWAEERYAIAGLSGSADLPDPDEQQECDSKVVPPMQRPTRN